MNTYQLDALAPLVFRSGKPFNSQAGADGANYPSPASAAGLLRTLHADQTRLPFNTDTSAALRAQACAGPLLAKRHQNGTLTALVPKPADAVYMHDGTTDRVMRLAPGALPEGTGCDLPDGLAPVLMAEHIDGKPVRGAQFWPLSALLAWARGDAVSHAALKSDGLEHIPTELRTHVALDDTTLASDPGRLFQTGGLDTSATRAGDNGGWHDADLVFLVRSALELAPTLATFGGERRLSRLSKTDAGWPDAPPALAAECAAAGGLRLTLLSPAIFNHGYLPGWIDPVTREGTPPGLAGLTLRLRAAAVERWEPVSGWDLFARRPKAMRKAVAAGAVYWFDIVGTPAAEQIEQLWLTPISDQPQSRLDGFGLALPTAWHPL